MYTVVNSAVYNIVFSTVFTLLFVTIYRKQGNGCSSGNKSAHPATLMSGNSLLYYTVYTVPYIILYTDAKSGIDKYTVYLTDHSTVHLPQYPTVLGIKLGVQ